MNDCRFGVSPVNYPDPDPVVKVSACNVFSFCNIKQCGSTSESATLAFYFSLAVYGLTGTNFDFTNFGRYCSKSEFYDVFK